MKTIKLSKTAMRELTRLYRGVLMITIIATIATSTSAKADWTGHEDTYVGPNGTATIFNENDGGGSMFTNTTNGTVSYVGTHDSSNGVDAQIYSIKDDTTGTIFDVSDEGIYYTKGTVKASTERMVEANEIATKGTVAQAITNAIGTANTAAAGEPSNATGFYKLYEEKQDWVDGTLGITSANPDAVKTALTGTIAGDETSFSSAINALDGAITTIQDTIGTANTAAAGEPSNATGVYKVFEDKQKWVDDTLGITSANPNAVKTEYASTNYLTTTETLTDADIALDAAIKGLETKAETVFAEKQAWVDKTLGITSAETDAVKNALTGPNAGDQTTFTKAINTLDSAIGNRTELAGTYVGSAVVGTDNTVAQNLQSLNNGLEKEVLRARTEEIRLDRKIDRLENKMEKGLAANAALAGLTPLSSEHKTQLSAAMGGYGSNQALAVGGFHYINNSTLLNVGGAYGGNSDISYKVGVTFGF